MEIRRMSGMDAASVQMVAEQQAKGNFAKELAAAGEKLKTDKDDVKLRQTCQELESVFINLMLTEMRKTVPKEDMINTRNQELFQSMMDVETTRNMSKAGGIGLADMMYRQLSQPAADPFAQAANAKKTSK
ncbi:rod-binding protein [Azotosporobacter soli]|uniref:rod-binding protein n=1 Tax=Azotosporobacter soli TaxID=3055040 RepID=UPI0031FEF3DF